MSRYNLPTNNPTIEAAIGWDAPLQTFFAQVERVNPDDEDENEMLVWEGTKFKQHAHLGFILPKLEPCCTVSPDLLKQLAQDQATSTQPSPLQLQMQERFNPPPTFHVLTRNLDEAPFGVIYDDNPTD